MREREGQSHLPQKKPRNTSAEAHRASGDSILRAPVFSHFKKSVHSEWLPARTPRLCRWTGLRWRELLAQRLTKLSRPRAPWHSSARCRKTRLLRVAARCPGGNGRTRRREPGDSGHGLWGTQPDSRTRPRRCARCTGTRDPREGPRTSGAAVPSQPTSEIENCRQPLMVLMILFS